MANLRVNFSSDTLRFTSLCAGAALSPAFTTAIRNAAEREVQKVSAYSLPEWWAYQRVEFSALETLARDQRIERHLARCAAHRARRRRRRHS